MCTMTFVFMNLSHYPSVGLVRQEKCGRNVNNKVWMESLKSKTRQGSDEQIQGINDMQHCQRDL